MRTAGLCVAAFALVAASLGAFGKATAQVYPSRPITMIVGFPAGGPGDTIARIVAEGMRRSLGQPIVIENITGATGAIAIGRAARAEPDGYTLSFGSWSTHVGMGAVLPLQYDLLVDFAPVALVVDSPLLLLARKNMPAKDLQELVAWLKKNPNAFVASQGIGGSVHIAGVFFQNRTGLSLETVQYRGSAAAIQDMIAERVDLTFDLAATALPHLQGGSVKAYAVLAKNRIAAAPDVPSVDEAGFPGLYMSSWQAIWVPKGTPKTIIEKLNSAVVDAVADPTVHKRLADAGLEFFPRDQQTPEALGALHKAEIEKWWPIIKAAGIKPQ